MPEIGMPVHFTYQAIEKPDEGDLFQGDILLPTEKIRAVFADVHPHFTDAKYVAFLVLTQTCDLVRRGGECKSRYINLAVVRPLRDVLFALLDKACGTVKVRGQPIAGTYFQDTKSKAKQLLERILNQNAQAEGIFYLHNDAAIEITEPCVALLQVSVAVKSPEHYEELVSARRGRLKEEFQSKLGWLIGNLFSRVATRDWSTKDREKMVAQFLHQPEGIGVSNPIAPNWVSREKVTTANRAGVKVAGMTTDQVLAVLEKHSPPPPKQAAIARAVECVRSVIEGVSEEQLIKIKDRLATDPVFESACK
jgi:hypothetical protein